MSMFLIAGCGGEGKQSEVSLDSLLITVPDNISPAAQVSKVNISATQGKNITLDASNSSDEDGAVVSYEWQLSDGTVLGHGKQLSYNTASLKPGSHKVRLIVTDDAGATGVVEFTLNIQERPVTPSPSPTPVTPSPSPTPDTTPPVITITGGSSTSVTQGSIYTDAGATATDDVDGTVSVTSTGSVDTSTLGSYTITYTATDAAGNMTTATRTVTVTLITHNGTTYGIVTSPYTGRVWLDRNLGAARVCQSFNDTACYGDYYQWGRNFDGHQDSMSTTTTIQATDVNNAGSAFITSGNANSYDWAKSADSSGSLRSANWSKTDGSSVCPTGFRVPTIVELRAETLDNGVTNRDTAFSNFLKLPSAGIRNYFDGSMNDVGSWGDVWSSSASGSYASILYFGSGYADWYSNGYRAYGRSVRCLRD